VVLVGLGVIVSAAIWYVVRSDADWNTWLFVWGVAIGVTGVLQGEVGSAYARGLLEGREDAKSTADRWRFRRRFNAATTLAFGLVVGLIAGGGNLFWFDAVMTGVALVVWVPSAFVGWRLLRRKP
jgi:hypothetical protein